MWPIGRKKPTRKTSTSSAEPPIYISPDIMGDRGLQRLDRNTSELRLWLPEVVKIALDETRRVHGVTTACWMREFFVIHLYGEHELLRMKINASGLYHRDPAQEYFDIPQARYSIPSTDTRDVLRGLGKSMSALKLFLPDRIKKDLQADADLAQTELSPHIRNLLISRLLGHQIWATSTAPWAQPADPGRADEWERGSYTGEPIPAADLPRNLGPDDVVVETSL